MKKKSTDNLQQELMKAPDLERFFHENKENFTNLSTPKALKDLFETRHLSKATLAKRAGMSEVYLHQLFSGRRNPSRKRVLCLCIGLSASVEEAQKLLLASGYAPLYAREPWDAVVIFGLTHGLPLQKVNELLYQHGLELLITTI